MFASPFLEPCEYRFDSFFVDWIGFNSSRAFEDDGVAVFEHQIIMVQQNKILIYDK